MFPMCMSNDRHVCSKKKFFFTLFEIFELFRARVLPWHEILAGFKFTYTSKNPVRPYFDRK
jgi:hypothetical protein